MGVRHASVLREVELPLGAISDINRETCNKVGQEYGVEEKHRYLSAIDMLKQVRLNWSSSPRRPLVTMTSSSLPRPMARAKFYARSRWRPVSPNART